MSCLHNYIGIKGCSVPVVADYREFVETVTGTSITSSGNVQFEIPDDVMVYRIVVHPSASSLGRIGTTDGGQQILPDTAFVSGIWKSISFDVFGESTIFIQGIVGTINIYQLTIQDYNAAPPPSSQFSGLYITQLAGLTLESIEKISEREQVNFIGVWKDVQDRSWIRILSDFKRLLRACYRLDPACDYSKFICENRQDFMHAWMFLLGAELMNERAYSTKMNRFTTVDRSIAIELRDHYTAEYEKAISDAVKTLNIPDDDECLQCSKQSIRFEEELP